MSDSYDDYELKMQLAEHAWEIKEARHTFRKNRIKENKMSREAMQMALDMLNEIADDVYCDQKLEGVITALRQALETEQEPVAYASDVEFDDETEIIPAEQKGKLGTAGLRIPLYIDPPASKPWVGLVWGELPEDGHNHDFLRGAAWAEAKLREKNT